MHGCDDHGTEEFDRLFDDVEMTHVERVETARIEGDEGRGTGHVDSRYRFHAVGTYRTKVTQVRP